MFSVLSISYKLPFVSFGSLPRIFVFGAATTPTPASFELRGSNPCSGYRETSSDGAFFRFKICMLKSGVRTVQSPGFPSSISVSKPSKTETSCKSLFFTSEHEGSLNVQSEINRQWKH